MLIKDEQDKLGKMGALPTLLDKEVAELRSKASKLSPADYMAAFRDRFKPKDIDTDVNWKKVFANHFDRNPPFTEKKPNEFSDAFVIEMLNCHRAPYLVIVSTDADFEDYAASNRDVILHRSLGAFTDQFLKAKESAAAMVNNSEECFQRVLPRVIEELSDYYSDSSQYEVECYHSEITSANIKSLKLTNHRLLGIDDDELFAVYKLTLGGKTELEISSSVVAYDSADKKDVHLGSNHNTATIDAAIFATIKVFLNRENPAEADFEIDENEIGVEDFVVPYEWTNFLDEGPEEEHE